MIMADEAVEQGEVETPEFSNVREAQAWARDHADLSIVQTDDEPEAPAPAEDDFGDIVPDAAASVEGEGAPAPADAAAAPADPFSEFGGRQTVQDAVTVATALRTEAGVRTIVAQGLQAIGYSPEEVSAFLNRQAAAAAAAPEADPYGDISDDDVVTGADVKALLSKAVADISSQISQQQLAAVQPVQEQIQQDRQRNATHAVDSTLAELLQIKDGTPNDVQKSQIGDVLAFAQQHLDPNEWDPNKIAAAVRQGYAAMTARDEARFKAYVTAKRAAREAAPANIGGASPPGGEEVKEPRNVKEAIAARKASGVF